MSFLIMATQGDQTWRIGIFRANNILRDRSVYIDVSTTALPWRDEPVPDLNKPVRLQLVPYPDAARQTVGMTKIFGGELDLGEFEIVPTESRVNRGYFTNELRPIPILTQEPDGPLD